MLTDPPVGRHRRPRAHLRPGSASVPRSPVA